MDPDLNQQFTHYWEQLTPGIQPSIAYINPEKKLLIHICKIRMLIIEQEIIWMSRPATKTLERIHDVNYKLMLIHEFLRLVKSDNHIPFLHALNNYKALNKKQILDCFTIPRGNNVSQELKQQISTNKHKCDALLELGCNFNLQDMTDMRTLFDVE